MRKATAGWALGAALLAGCSASGTVYDDGANPSAAPGAPGAAEVVVFRTHHALEGGAARVKMDGEVVAHTENGGYNRLWVTPGTHVIEVDLSMSPGSCTLSLQVAAGSVSYLEISERAGSLVSGVLAGFVGQAIETSGRTCGGSWMIEPVPPDVARPKLSGLHES